MTIENTIKSLQSSLTCGLSLDEVATRLGQYGYSEIPEKKTNPLKTFSSKFWGLTAWMLQYFKFASVTGSLIWRVFTSR
jgi:H+-transporting ATPase